MMLKTHNNKMMEWGTNYPSNFLSEEKTIENKLLYGDLVDIERLFDQFDPGKIRKIWEEKLVPNDLYYVTNCFIAKVFYNIEDPIAFINEKVKEVLKM